MYCILRTRVQPTMDPYAEALTQRHMSCKVLRTACTSVCLSVCLLRCLKTTYENVTKFSVPVTRGRGSVLFRRQWKTLCASCFVDDVTFSHNGPYGMWCWQYLCERVPEQVVINLQRIRQGAPRCLISLAMTTCRTLPLVGGLQRAV